MKPTRLPQFLLVLALALLVPNPARTQVPDHLSEEDLQKLRDRLDELQALRNEPPGEELPWEDDPSMPPNTLKSVEAVLHLSSESYKLGVLWVIRSLERPKDSAVRACIQKQGEDWLILPSGEYEITLTAGRAARAWTFLKPRRVRLRRGMVYHSRFSLDSEETIMRRLRDMEPRPENPAEDPGDE